jgi:hypothetical protein
VKPIIASIVVFALAIFSSGCTHYSIEMQKQNGGQATTIAYPPPVKPLDLYTSVFVEAHATPDGKALNICGQSIVDSFLFKTQKAILIGLTIPNTNIILPIYTVAQGDACSIDYQQRYIFTPQTLINLPRQYIVRAKYSYDVKSTEQVTKYVLQAASLAQTLAPQGAPVLATLSMLGGSQIFNNISNAFSNAFSQSDNLNDSIASFNLNDDLIYEKVVNYTILSRILDSSRRVDSDNPPIILGTVAITINRTPTLIGYYNPGHPIDYSRLDHTTKILVLVRGSDGSLHPQEQYLYNLVNEVPNTALDRVKLLEAGATRREVRDRCIDLRGKLRDVGLNSLDSAVFLWRVFTWSDYSFTSQPLDATRQHACLTDAERDIVLGFGLTNWLVVANSLHIGPDQPLRLVRR